MFVQNIAGNRSSDFNTMLLAKHTFYSIYLGDILIRYCGQSRSYADE